MRKRRLEDEEREAGEAGRQGGGQRCPSEAGRGPGTPPRVERLPLPGAGAAAQALLVVGNWVWGLSEQDVLGGGGRGA